MIDFEAARVKMVENQIRTTDVTAHSVLQAFLTVQRENFVPAKSKSLAYIDNDVEICPGRFLMEASPLAKLLQLAAITKSDTVLEVGTGSGYISALLSLLAKSVVSIESDEALAEQAIANLAGAHNVTVVTGDMERGVSDQGPYDVIFIAGSIEDVPAELSAQLKDGGRLVAVLGYGNAAQATLFVKEQGALSKSAHFNASIKPLPGFRRAKDFVF
ncbi:protein-L-isoaspartate O-methyltransferase [Rhizobium sp. CFBP 13726]|uniref:protein-L-isoaspartate O-methyltransferase family protein n=1 Tax=Rhizobium sp. CFBP 13726 TaxID=2775296 RepID=UPI00177E11B2|nr:protein-L-isoaspartate O-methyltransferase [Rhizobium sp. CFBP 13726]MBD8650210.1 protein-L-isoaspartate O-methyltransferase [Rhizobium sp. CFBP 13726]